MLCTDLEEAEEIFLRVLGEVNAVFVLPASKIRAVWEHEKHEAKQTHEAPAQLQLGQPVAYFRTDPRDSPELADPVATEHVILVVHVRQDLEHGVRFGGVLEQTQPARVEPLRCISNTPKTIIDTVHIEHTQNHDRYSGTAAHRTHPKPHRQVPQHCRTHTPKCTWECATLVSTQPWCLKQGCALQYSPEYR